MATGSDDSSNDAKIDGPSLIGWANETLLRAAVERSREHPERIESVVAAASGADRPEKERRRMLVQRLREELPAISALPFGEREAELQRLALRLSVELNAPRLAEWAPMAEVVEALQKYSGTGGKARHGPRWVATHMLIATGEMGVRRKQASASDFAAAFEKCLETVR